MRVWIFGLSHLLPHTEFQLNILMVFFSLLSSRFICLVSMEYIATDKYKAGYADCAREVARYLSTPEPPPLPSVPSLADNGCKTRLLRHLDQCIAEIETEICPRLDSATNATAKSTISDKPGYVYAVSTHTQICPNIYIYIRKT